MVVSEDVLHHHHQSNRELIPAHAVRVTIAAGTAAVIIMGHVVAMLACMIRQVMVIFQPLPIHGIPTSWNLSGRQARLLHLNLLMMRGGCDDHADSCGSHVDHDLPGDSEQYPG